MIRSRAETLALIQRAARGAGLPPGHAEDVARAAVTALAADPSCATGIAAALTAPAGPVACQDDGSTLHIPTTRVVWAGPMIRDALDAGALRIVAGQVDCPALLAAMLPGATVEDAGSGILVRPAGTPAPVTRGPVDIAPAVWAAFEALAARTLVPDTDLSRRAGAGASDAD